MRPHLTLLVLAILIFSSPHSFARSQRVYKIPAHKIGKWMKTTSSSLSSNGMQIADANTCQKLDVEITKESLQYRLRCGSLYTSGLLPLDASNAQFKVQKRKSSVLVYKMGYYGLKIQTGKTKQRMVRMPFVEEVVRFQVLPDKSLSFYKETFVVDDYGRVVQKSFLQAFGLSTNLPKYTAN